MTYEIRYATILAFDVQPSVEAKKIAEKLGVRIFTADIIYHLFDQFTAFIQGIEQERINAVCVILCPTTG